jgi:hypothetical protein
MYLNTQKFFIQKRKTRYFLFQKVNASWIYLIFERIAENQRHFQPFSAPSLRAKFIYSKPCLVPVSNFFPANLTSYLLVNCKDR